MGPKCVLQVLLCCAFGMPFAEILPFGAQQHSRPSSEMLARTSCFHSSCSQAVQAGSRRSVTEGGVCATVRAVLFDVFHSVSELLLLVCHHAALLEI